MKCVINDCYGGFGISKKAKKILGIEWDNDIKRTDEKLIALIEERGSEFVSVFCANLKIVEIPEEATDWEINEYNGSESITCVVNGKLRHIH